MPTCWSCATGRPPCSPSRTARTLRRRWRSLPVNAAPAAAPPVAAAFADVDHDGDLDVIVGGVGDAAAGCCRTTANGTFTDITAAAGVAGATGAPLPLVPTDFDNRRDVDLLLVASSDRLSCSSQPARRDVSRTSRPTSVSATVSAPRCAGGGRRQQGRVHRFLLRPRRRARRPRAERRPRRLQDRARVRPTSGASPLPQCSWTTTTTGCSTS